MYKSHVQKAERPNLLAHSTRDAGAAGLSSLAARLLPARAMDFVAWRQMAAAGLTLLLASVRASCCSVASVTGRASRGMLLLLWLWLSSVCSTRMGVWQSWQSLPHEFCGSKQGEEGEYQQLQTQQSHKLVAVVRERVVCACVREHK